MATYAEQIIVQSLGVFAGGDPATNLKRLQQGIEHIAAAPTRDEYASAPRIVFPPADDPYDFDGDIIINRNMIIEGSVPHGRSQSACKLRFTPNARAGIFVRAPGGITAPSSYSNEIGPGGYSGGRTQINNLALEPIVAGTVDFGIVHNVPVDFQYVQVREFRRAGFFAFGQTSGTSNYPNSDATGGIAMQSDGVTRSWGNTDGSLYLRCHALLMTEGHGFVASGNDSQIMQYIGCDAVRNRGCGFRDNSGIGNHYWGCHSAGNTIKVSHNGIFYMPIKPHFASASTEPGIGAQWREYWVPVRATIAHTVWTFGTFYRDAGGLVIVDAANKYPTILGHYTEGGIEYGVIPRGATTILGGVAGSGRIYLGPDSKSVHVLGTNRNTPYKWVGGDLEGQYKWGSNIGTTVLAPTMFEAGHTHDPDSKQPGKRGIKLVYSTVRSAYEWVKGNATRIMTITAEGWSQGPYSGAGHVYFNKGLIVGGRTSAHISAVPNVNSISRGTEVQKGQLFILTNARPGEKAFAMVTTGGIVGSGAVIKKVGAIDP